MYFITFKGKNKGINNAAVGIILSSFQLIGFLMSPVWGIYVSNKDYPFSKKWKYLITV